MVILFKMRNNNPKQLSNNNSLKKNQECYQSMLSKSNLIINKMNKKQ